MKEIKLADFLRCKGTQPQLAKAVGVTQSAVSQMAKSSRDIRVRVFEDGRIEVIELRILNRCAAVRDEAPPNMPVTIPAIGHQHITPSGAVHPSSTSQASP
ncbi:Cro/CI family transcriptional regulator [Pseudomonas asiatica]|uniref:Cro/CI family transcriptional regulator n=1 Tax=Pseudomonas asiatica TaxID=2219225 RepID=UPI001E44EE8C|nr:Cro/CI family transcriptional regulator [Pseudomonas asiatica]MCE1099484.1 Cro/CI family transcriptional regulator [Pseudomonas asiatica]MCE1104959.1 Cro/CI family transcriptional regulator [Pseudomonas asiatica]